MKTCVVFCGCGCVWCLWMCVGEVHVHVGRRNMFFLCDKLRKREVEKSASECAEIIGLCPCRGWGTLGCH